MNILTTWMFRQNTPVLPLNPPSNIIAYYRSDIPGAASISVTWDNAPSPGEVGTFVERSSDGGVTWTTIAAIPNDLDITNGSNYTDYNLDSVSAYLYRVCAYRGSERSAYAATDTPPMSQFIPVTPVSVSINAVFNDQIDIVFDTDINNYPSMTDPLTMSCFHVDGKVVTIFAGRTAANTLSVRVDSPYVAGDTPGKIWYQYLNQSMAIQFTGGGDAISSFKADIVNNLTWTAAPGSNVITVGSTGDYLTLYAAISAINTGLETGDIVINITEPSNVLVETDASVLGENTAPANYDSVIIYTSLPSMVIESDAIAGPVFTCLNSGPVIIDGRQNRSGADKALTFSSTNVADYYNQLIRVDGAEGDVSIENCTLNLYAGFGIKGTNIKNNFTVKSCNIFGVNDKNTGGIDVSTLYGPRTDKKVLLQNNTIWDVYGHGFLVGEYAVVYGIYTNGNNIHIDGNSVALMNPLPAAFHSNIVGIELSACSMEEHANYATNNYIGGSLRYCQGPAMSNNSVTDACALTGISTYASQYGHIEITNNVIQNIDWRLKDDPTNSGFGSTFIGIWGQMMNNGNGVNIISNNTIGSQDNLPTKSIIVVPEVAGPVISGLLFLWSMKTVLDGVTVGSIDVTAPTNAMVLGIGWFGGVSEFEVNNCIVGSKSTPGSIVVDLTVDMGQPQFHGISSGQSLLTARNSTVANADVYGQASIYGIYAQRQCTIDNNVIRNLSAFDSSINAIQVSGSQTCNITKNKVFNISVLQGTTGINVATSAQGNNVDGNYVGSLNLLGTIGSMYGMQLIGGTTSATNNVINLVSNIDNATVYGISETGTAVTRNRTLAHNVVLLSGSNISGASNASYALRSGSAVNTKSFKNNIFINKRSTPGSTNKHFAIYLAYTSAATLTLDYNNYVASGIGGTLGYYNNLAVTSLPIVAGQGVHDTNVPVIFRALPDADGLRPVTPLPAVSSGFTFTDYDGLARTAYNKGAFERQTAPAQLVYIYTSIGIGSISVYYSTRESQWINIAIQRSETGPGGGFIQVDSYIRPPFALDNPYTGSWTDSDVVAATDYWYRVLVTGSDGAALYSSVVHARTDVDMVPDNCIVSNKGELAPGLLSAPNKLILTNYVNGFDPTVALSVTSMAIAGNTITGIKYNVTGGYCYSIEIELANAYANGDVIPNLVCNVPAFSRVLVSQEGIPYNSFDLPVTNDIVLGPQILSAVVEDADKSTIAVTFDTDLGQVVGPDPTSFTCNLKTVTGVMGVVGPTAYIGVDTPFANGDVITLSLDSAADPTFNQLFYPSAWCPGFNNFPVTNNIL